MGGVRNYSDAACTLPITTVTIPAGQSLVTFYVKPVSGVMVTQTAMASFATATRTLSVIPAVRRGSCTINGPVGLPDGGTQFDYSANCGISPPLQNIAHTALFYTATAGSGQSATSKVKCRITAVSNVYCTRSGGNATGTIHVQTLELPAGMRVERMEGTVGADVFSLAVPTAVNPATSFVLKSMEGSGNDIDAEDLPTAQLVGGTSVLMDYGNSAGSGVGDTYSVQVVELSGLSVQRGTEDGGLPSGSGVLSVSGLPASSLNTALLTQNGADNGGPSICEVLVRGDMPTSSSLKFTRAAGATGVCLASALPQVVWERLDFGTRGKVQTFTTTQPVGTSTTAVTITPVDTTRTLVFASSQDVSGQGVGETSGDVTNLSDGEARFELASSTVVNVTRQHSSGIAIFTFYVVEIDP